MAPQQSAKQRTLASSLTTGCTLSACGWPAAGQPLA
jgi:hypothetical protein